MPFRSVIMIVSGDVLIFLTLRISQDILHTQNILHFTIRAPVIGPAEPVGGWPLSHSAAWALFLLRISALVFLASRCK
jgi:hypothetical protein